MRPLVAALVAAAATTFMMASTAAAERASEARVTPARLAAKACKARKGTARRACVARRLRSTCRARRYRQHRDCRVVRRESAPGPAPAPAPVPDPGPPAAPAPTAELFGAVEDPVAPGAPVIAPVTPVAPAVILPPALSRMQVTAREFSLTPSRTVLPAGVTRVELLNLGEDPHDLRARPAAGGADDFAFPSVTAGNRHTQDVTLGPGTWTFFCALPEHEVLGMGTTVTVP